MSKFKFYKGDVNWIYNEGIVESVDKTVPAGHYRRSINGTKVEIKGKDSDFQIFTPSYAEVTQIQKSSTPNDNYSSVAEFIAATEEFFAANSTILTNSEGIPIDVQNPLPTDGDSIYCKDIDVDLSDIGDFSGEVCDLFNDYQKLNIANAVIDGGVNPKSFTVTFKRPLIGSTVGLGSSEALISNAKLTIFGIAGQIIKLIDFSDDDTKRENLVFSFEQKIFAGIIVEFYTDDRVSLSGAGLTKSQSVSIDAINGIVSIDNSTNELLGIDGIYSGNPVDTKNYGIILCSVYSDVASAINGLIIEFSTDLVNWLWNDEYSIEATKGKTFSVQTQARYMRVRYINGPVAQTFFRLETTLKPVYIKPSSHRIADTISGEDDAELMKAVLTGKDQNDVFRNINSTEDGDLSISDNSSGLSIAEGKVTGKSFVHKFGIARDFDTADLDVTIWDGADDAGVDQMNYVYSTTADIDSLISNDVDDNVDIRIFGLDADWNEVEQTITLNGQTRVALTTNLIRVYRMYNDGAVDLQGIVSCFVNGPTTGGNVDNSADVRAIIDGDSNQTQMAVFSIPAGKTAYVREWYANIGGASKSTNYVISLYAREFGKVFRLRHVSALSDGGTSYIQHKFTEPPFVLEKTDIELRCYITATGVSQSAIAGGFDIVLVDN